MGEVREPGPVALTGRHHAHRALARRCPRPSQPPASCQSYGRLKGPRTPAVAEPEPRNRSVSRVDPRAQSGQLAQNIELRDGDTIFVPCAEAVYVFGQVKTPGAYGIQVDTTVLQALSLAGGVTEQGAMNRIRVMRIENGTKKEIKVQAARISSYPATRLHRPTALLLMTPRGPAAWKQVSPMTEELNQCREPEPQRPLRLAATGDHLPQMSQEPTSPSASVTHSHGRSWKQGICSTISECSTTPLDGRHRLSDSADRDDAVHVHGHAALRGAHPVVDRVGQPERPSPSRKSSTSRGPRPTTTRRSTTSCRAARWRERRSTA